MNADERRLAVWKIPPACPVLLRIPLAIRNQRRIIRREGGEQNNLPQSLS